MICGSSCTDVFSFERWQCNIFRSRKRLCDLYEEEIS